MAEAFPYQPPLRIGSIGTRSSGFWGMILLVISETSVFIYLLFAYYYFAVQAHPGPWPPGGPPTFLYSGPQCGVLLIGSATMWWANRAAARGNRLSVLIGLAITLLLGAGFVALQFLDWYDKPFSLATDSYSSLYFVITGAHLAHVVAGDLMLIAVIIWTALRYFGPVRHAPVTAVALYWYFLTAIWLALFFTLYGTPYLS